MKVPKDNQFCLAYLKAQQYKQLVKALGGIRFGPAYLVVYKLCRKVKTIKKQYLSDLCKTCT